MPPLLRLDGRDRQLEAHRCEAVVAEGVVGRAEVDRHGDPDVVDRRPVAPVVLAHATGDGGQEGVVQRAVDGVGGAAQLLEGHVEGAQLTGEAPVAHDR